MGMLSICAGRRMKSAAKGRVAENPATLRDEVALWR
jgi:hypothetical protein